MFTIRRNSYVGELNPMSFKAAKLLASLNIPNPDSTIMTCRNSAATVRGEFDRLNKIRMTKKTPQLSTGFQVPQTNRSLPARRKCSTAIRRNDQADDCISVTFKTESFLSSLHIP